VVFTLNVGFLVRNTTVFGSPLGPPDEGAPALQYRNAELTPTLFMSNVARDLGVNLVATPWAAVNIRSLNLVKAIHTLIGADIQDPRTTWGGELFREQRVDQAYDENVAGNPVHLVLALITLVAMWPLRRRLMPSAPLYAAALVSGFLLFAATLRWQPWDSRLELPWFVLFAPLFGVVCEAIGARIAACIAAVLVFSMLPWVMNNQARPLLGPGTVLDTTRASQYFIFQPDLEPAYEEAAAFLADQHCSQVGFISNQDGWEYPLWVLSPAPLQVKHVAVSNVSHELAATAFPPCAIVALGPAFVTNPIQIDGQTFQPVWTQDYLVVLTADTP
jgi:hypothetical protein